MFTEFSTMQQQQLHHSRLIRGVSLHGGVDCSQPYLASYVIDKSRERVTSPKAALLYPLFEQLGVRCRTMSV
jgi:hypothetical protein